jgi:hypothetical protein
LSNDCAERSKVASSNAHFGDASCQISREKSCRFLRVPLLAALGREIILIPPLQFGLRRQRRLAGFLATDQIAADRDHRLAALGPQRRDDVGGAGAPVETAKGRLLDFQGIHQIDDIAGECRRLAVADRIAGEKARGAVAAQIRHDHTIARGCELRCHIDEAMNVVGPAMQQDDRTPARGTRFGVADIQQAGVDLLERPE